MKVKDLIAALSEVSPDADVILQRDAEGNGYSPLYAVDADAVYKRETPYSGDVYSTAWTADDACMTEREWEKVLQKPRCVVLAPTN